MDINTDVVVFPVTLEQRKKIHDNLCAFTFNPTGYRGLTAYIRKITSSHDLKQVIKWIDLYSPLEIEKQVNGSLIFKNKKNGKLLSHQNAVNNPYYLIQSIQSKAELFKATTILPPGTKGASQTSKKEFDKKVIKGCLEDFLKNPTSQNKKRLDSLLDSYLDTPTPQRGTLTISAGLPSLGKKR